MNWARFDTMAWPRPDVAMAEIEWRLRHGTPSKADIMAAASVISAYRQMVFDPEKKRRVVIRHLRESVGVPSGPEDDRALESDARLPQDPVRDPPEGREADPS